MKHCITESEYSKRIRHRYYCQGNYQDLQKTGDEIRHGANPVADAPPTLDTLNGLERFLKKYGGDWRK